ncbi:hypothetical protein [Agromyces sp. NPDC058110]|uniref:hypothetical protein n=1 Tax=Agromyces sp. NPDC058110 TaxID=3346345 RepID=UPI0036D9455A
MSNLNASDAARYPTTTQPLSPGLESEDDAAGKVSTLAADAGEATKHVADTAKGEAREVASEAGHQARKLLGQVGDELRGQAATQQARAADALHATGSSLSRMADSSDDDGYAPQLVRAAGDRIDSVANWLGTKDPGEVVEDVKRFARRRPGIFIAIAVGAGLIVGRVVRSLASPQAGDQSRPSHAASESDPSTPAIDAPPVPPLRETVAPTPAPVGASAGVTATTGTFRDSSDFPTELGDPR